MPGLGLTLFEPRTRCFGPMGTFFIKESVPEQLENIQWASADLDHSFFGAIFRIICVLRRRSRRRTVRIVCLRLRFRCTDTRGGRGTRIVDAASALQSIVDGLPLYRGRAQ